MGKCAASLLVHIAKGIVKASTVWMNLYKIVKKGLSALISTWMSSLSENPGNFSHVPLFLSWHIYLYVNVTQNIGKDLILCFAEKHAILWPPVLSEHKGYTGITIWMCLSEEMTLRELLLFCFVIWPFSVKVGSLENCLLVAQLHFFRRQEVNNF